MKNFGSIWRLLKASLKMTVRNKQALVWTFMLPVILMVLFGLAFGKSRTITLNIGVVDQAKNTFSRQYVKGLEKIDAFKITQNRKDTELKSLRDGDRSVVIVIPAGFGDSVAKYAEAKKKLATAGLQAQQIAVTKPGQPGALPTDASTNALTIPKIEPSTLQVYFDKANPSVSGSAKSMLNQIDLNMSQKASGSPSLFKMEEKNVTSHNYSNIDFFAAGILAMFLMQGGTVGVLMILVGYRERGILRRLQVTPLSVPAFMGTQIAVRVIVALMQMALLLAIAILVFGAHVVGSLWVLAAVVIEGSLVFIALGFAIASFAQTNQTAQALGSIVTMPMMFLSGVFFPTDSFPKFVQPIIKILPLTYLANALREVIMRGAGFDKIAHNMLVLAVFGVVIFMVGVFAFKWE